MNTLFARRIAHSLLLALPFIFLNVSTTVKAADTGSLLITCQNDSLEFSSICLGFMAGVDETHNSMRQLLISLSDKNNAFDIKENWPGFYCSPMTLTPEQLRDVFVSYALSNPETAQWPAATTTLVALAETLPCSN